MRKNVIDAAVEKSQESTPMAVLEKGGKRYFYFQKLKNLGLENLYSSIDMKAKIAGPSTNPEDHPEWAEFISLMPQEHSEYYFMYQKHTDLAFKVDEEGMGERLGLGRRFPEPDGLYTSRPDFLLSSSFADCAPVLFFAPEAKVQANVHSGWRGTLANIGGKTITRMVQDYNLEAEDFYVFIGPHIGKDDFEVSQDVADLFATAYPELPNLVRDMPGKEAKYLVDLNLCIIYNLLKAGVSAERIFSVNRSTVAHPEDYHSFRRDKEKFNLMMVLSQIID